ncbi:MAG: cytochrome c oxidase subunit II [SAR202 cluster bacterium]|nr:cytochrome c oxidase subunit II [SAR202 cluster bacterium]
MNGRGSLLPRAAAIILPGIFLLWLFLFGSDPNTHQSTWDPRGPVARLQLDLFWWIFWAAVFVYIVVEIALVYAIFRFRRRPGDGMPTQTHGNTRLEIAWTIAPSVILAIIAVPTVSALWKVLTLPNEGVRLEVNAVAHQWWWEFNYPSLGIKTANELHIPQDTVAVIHLESKDVIHSLWVPKLGGKIDMVPGRKNMLWLQGDEPGVFYGHCAEFCGEAHSLMRFRAVVHTQADFDAWVAAQRLPAAAPPAGQAATGRDIFMGKGACIGCHTVRGTNAQSPIGPDLTHVGSRLTIAAGILDNNHNNLVKWLANPEGIKPGNLMATVIGSNIKFTPDELNALATYLESLK